MDTKKFDALQQLVVKGKLEEEQKVGDVMVGYRTLNHDQEVAAISKATSSPFAIKVEQLTFAITSLNGQKIGDSEEEREYLRQLLGGMNSVYINELYKPFLELSGKVPPLTLENVKAPLEQDQQLEASMKSATEVDTFQTIH